MMNRRGFLGMLGGSAMHIATKKIPPLPKTIVPAAVEAPAMFGGAEAAAGWVSYRFVLSKVITDPTRMRIIKAECS